MGSGPLREVVAHGLEFKENIYVSVLVLGCHLCKFQSIFLRRIIS